MSAAQMEKHLFNLKFASKQLLRDSKKADKEEKAEKNKLKKAIEKGNTDVARIHAENAIRQKNQSLNYLRMSARIDAVASRVQTAVTMKRVTSSMQGVVKAMDSAMKSMNLEKVCRHNYLNERTDNLSVFLQFRIVFPDIWADGQVREGVRGSGRTDFSDGEHYG